MTSMSGTNLEMTNKQQAGVVQMFNLFIPIDFPNLLELLLFVKLIIVVRER